MTPKTERKCDRCGVNLDRINYVEPDWEGYYDNLSTQRPPLCKPCWVKADHEAAQRHKESHDTV